MAESLGRGTIELVADARAFRATMAEAKKSINDLGRGQRDTSAAASRSIDQYIAKLKLQNATVGLSTREASLYRLAVKGASDAQIAAANSALIFQERQAATVRTMATLRAGLIASGAAIAAFTLAGKGVADTADELLKLSQRTGIGVEALSALKFQADLSGVSFEQLQTALRFYNARISDAAGGSKEALAAFQAMGFTQQDLQAALSDSETFLARVADKFAGYADGASRSALAADIFGAKNEKLVLLLGQGSAGIQAARQELERYSAIIGPDLAKRSEELNDNITRLKYIAEGLAISIGSSLIPKLADLSNELLQGTQIAGGFGKALMLFASINPFRSISENIKATRAEIDRLAEAQARALQQGRAGAADGYAKALEAEQKRLQFLQFQQRAAIKTGDPSTFDARDLRRLQGDVKPQAPVVDKVVAASTGSAGDGGADRLARAQQQAQLAALRRASDASIAEFQRAERILEAERQDALNDEAAYYEAKRAFVQLNLRETERAAAAELEILRAQTFSGKDAALERLENAERIADVEAKLAKARADATVETVLLDSQQAASLRRLAQSFEDARASADAYIDSIRRRNAAELVGIGRGQRARDERAGEFEIEQRFLQERRRLEGERRREQITQPAFEQYLRSATEAYRQELDEYRTHTAALRIAQGDWLAGAREAFANYADDTRNTAKQFEDAFGNAIRRTEDVLVDFLETGKLDVRGFATSITSELNRIFVKERITGPLAEGLKSGDLLGSVAGLFGGRAPGTQAAAPVVDRDVAGIIAGTATSAVDGAAFTGAVTAAGATFSTSTIAAGTSISATLTAAGASLATTITAAGAQFAATVGAAGGGGGGGLADIASLALDSFAMGTPYVPKTGLYQLHKGEAVLTAAENARGGGSAPGPTNNFAVTVNAPPGMDRRTAAQMGVEFARSAQRELARGTA